MKIKKHDVIESIANSLQDISYYHDKSFVKALHNAYKKETNIAAKNAISQILINSKMAAISKRPICQDTGIVNIFVEVGMDARFDSGLSLDDMINEGVKLAYTNKSNPLRASIVKDILFTRENTKNNTPAVINYSVVKGNKVDFYIAAKGAGSENKSKFTVLNPSESIVDWVVKTVPEMGAGWCPPGILGIGVGGTSEKAMLMAKRSLFENIDINNVITKGPKNKSEELRLEIYEKINALGIGAQGLGGLTTVLDVKLNQYPTHAASLPIAMIPNCAATRHTHFTLDGCGVAKLKEVDIDDYPKIDFDLSQYTKVDLNNLDKNKIKNFKTGDTLLLSGTIITGRDAAHKRLQMLIENKKPLPKEINFKNRFIYYVGPVDAVGDEVVGPAGPTTSTRMDKFSDMMFENTEILGMIGKAERGINTVNSIKKHKSLYLIAVGGAAYLISKAIKKAKILAFEDLGMEAIYEFEVKNMPVMVAVNSQGINIHQTISR